MVAHSFGATMPVVSAIRARTGEIRRTWSPEEYARRTLLAQRKLAEIVNVIAARRV